MSRETRSSSSPFGPLTRTRSGSTATSTPDGTGIGCFPIRLIALPDLRDDLAADALAPRVVAGHQALRGRHDRGAHPAEHARDVRGGDVGAPARLRHAAQAADHSAVAVGVLQPDAQRFADARALDRPALDVTLLLEDAGHLGLHLRVRDQHLVVARAQAVADAGQEVGDRIRHRHRGDLPARLRYARDHALRRDLAQADPAQPELAEVCARAAAALAAVVGARLVLRRALLLDDL